MTLYHGGTDIVKEPRIITSYTGRDFGIGFYTTDIKEQAVKWAKRQALYRKKEDAILNGYDIIIGKIANDDVGETVQAVADGLTPKDFALSKLVFMKANNQTCFSTETALKHLDFFSSERVGWNAPRNNKGGYAAFNNMADYGSIWREWRWGY